MGKYEAKEPEKKYTPQQSLMLYLHDLIYLLTAIILIFTLIFRIVVVSGPSMFDTLMDGDYLLLLSNTFYHNPKQGDVVVLSKETYDNGTPIVNGLLPQKGRVLILILFPETISRILLIAPYS